MSSEATKPTALPRLRAYLWYAATGLLATGLILWWIGQPLDAYSLPFTWTGDAAYYYTKAKELLEFGDTWTNQRLGAPGVSAQYDLPYHPIGQYGLLWLLAQLTGNAASAMNLYFVLGFPAAALAALWVMRHFGASYEIGSACALLFAFQYYHLWRFVQHPMLSSYWLVPLVIMAALWLTEEKWPWHRWPSALLIAAACGVSHAYYSFFACFLVLVAGIVGLLGQRSSKPVFATLGMLALLVGGGVVSVWPSIEYRWQTGSNQTVGQRNIGEAEHYGLKVGQLVLPHQDHRIAALGRASQLFDEANPASPESQSAALGALAGIGFVLLLWLALSRLAGRSPPPPLGQAATLNLALLLLAVKGGLCALVAIFLPELRGYTRASIFVAFLSLLVLALLLSRIQYKAWRFLGVPLLLVVGLLDQTPPAPRNDLMPVADGVPELVATMEKALPKGAMVFQLPLVSFPEAGATQEMPDYEHLEGYFFSEHLRWSYGAVKGRNSAPWIRYTALRPVDDMIDRLRAEKFAAIWVNLRGYSLQEGEDLIEDLQRLLGNAKWQSKDGSRLVFEL